MYQPPIFFDPVFVINVIAGFLVTVAGALLLLVAAIWAVVAGEWSHERAKPAAWRGLCALGVAAFIAGWVWQAIGYYRVGALTFQ
jgi:hypothetical protein